MFENMTQREKVLGTIVLSSLVIGVLWIGFMTWRSSYNTLSQRNEALQDQLDDFDVLQIKAKRAMDRKEQYRNFSLNSNPDVGRTEYDAWLFETAKSYGCENIKPSRSLNSIPLIFKERQPNGQMTSRTIGNTSSFTLNFTSDLSQLTEFLHHFFAADVMHRISSMTIDPEIEVRKESDQTSEEINRLKVNLEIDAISLTDAADNKEFIVEKNRAERLAFASLEQYKQKILARNIFGFPNNAPRFTSDEEIEATIGEDISFTIRASDEDENDLEYELVSTNIPGAKLRKSSGNAAFTAPAIEKLGEFEAIVKVKDDHPDSKSAEMEMLIAIVPVENNEPQFKTDGNIDVVIGKPIKIEIEASDGDDDELTYEMNDTSVEEAKFEQIEGKWYLTAPAVSEEMELDAMFTVTDTNQGEDELVLTINIVPPDFDPAKMARVGSVTWTNGVPRAWIYRIGGRDDLFEGDEAQYGSVKLKVVKFLDKKGSFIAEVNGEEVLYKPDDPLLEPRTLPKSD